MKLGLHDTWILMSLFKAGKQILLVILATRNMITELPIPLDIWFDLHSFQLF